MPVWTYSIENHYKREHKDQTCQDVEIISEAAATKLIDAARQVVPRRITGGALKAGTTRFYKPRPPPPKRKRPRPITLPAIPDFIGAPVLENPKLEPVPMFATLFGSSPVSSEPPLKRLKPQPQSGEEDTLYASLFESSPVSSEPPLKRFKPQPQSIEEDTTPKVKPKLQEMTQEQLHAEREHLMQNVPTEATELGRHQKRLKVIAANLRIRFHDLSVYKT